MSFEEGKQILRLIYSLLLTFSKVVASQNLRFYLDRELQNRRFWFKCSRRSYKGKDLFITPIQGLYDYIATTTPPAKAGAVGKAYTCTITSISVVGNAASVEMAMDGYHEHDFTDYFQLLKVDGRWWIVSKLFHADPQSK
jgi:hypothetical protein